MLVLHNQTTFYFMLGPQCKRKTAVWLLKTNKILLYIYVINYYPTLSLVTGEQEVAGVNCTRRCAVETHCG